jgi:hypothetical protein
MQINNEINNVQKTYEGMKRITRNKEGKKGSNQRWNERIKEKRYKEGRKHVIKARNNEGRDKESKKTRRKKKDR